MPMGMERPVSVIGYAKPPDAGPAMIRGISVSVQKRTLRKRKELDKRIVELVASMPPTMKFAGGKTKYMLVEAVKNLLPKQIVERKDKMGFPVPINEWMKKKKMKDFLSDTFNSKKSRERGIFKVEEILDQINRSGKFSRDIWGALNLELWYQNFHDK